MRVSIGKNIIRPIQRAVVEFDLLTEGDRVLIGLSGGKDSLLLLNSMAVLRRILPFPIEAAAITIDMGFKSKEETDLSSLTEMCSDNEMIHHVIRAELSQEILSHTTQNPCARCSYFRRALIHNFAKSNGFNKVALAHHQDDAVETFFMNILFSGQLSTFLPKTYLDKTGITVIRPLIYLREKDIINAVKKMSLTPLSAFCPISGITKRAEVKGLIKELKKDNKNIYCNLAAAMRGGSHVQLWPEALKKEDIWRKSHQFWERKLQ